MKHQTGGAQQHINKNNVESFTIVCPPEDIISEYKNIVSSLYSQISKNCFEIENLTKLRDTLLPKLMSGEIDVSKINYDLDEFEWDLINKFGKESIIKLVKSMNVYETKQLSDIIKLVRIE